LQTIKHRNVQHRRYNTERRTQNVEHRTQNTERRTFTIFDLTNLFTHTHMETIELQKTFFQHIKDKLPAHISFAEEIAEVLDISTDSSYRRIRGEKPITFEEIKKLCETYSVSLDHILSLNINSTVFFGDWVDAENFNFEKYLEDMLFQVKQIVAAPKKLFYYEAKDIPPFYHFQFPELATFKYFFWMKTILSYDKYSKTCFEDADLNGIIKKTGKEIFQAYSKLPSSEIWSPETINSTLRQIEFYKDSGVFKSKDTIRSLYEQLHELISHIERQAERGVKFSDSTDNRAPVSFQLFCNEVFLGHNTIYFEVQDIPNVFINHGVLNYMITRNKRFCDYTKKSFENTMKKSSLISGVNEKERFRYFKNMKDKVENRVAALKSAH
jgi:hypothetical protein